MDNFLDNFLNDLDPGKSLVESLQDIIKHHKEIKYEI